MRARPLVISHANCYDGFTAAWVFHKFYETKKGLMDADPEYWPAHYGEAPPDVSGRDVYVLDFSYDRETMMKIILSSNRTFVFDHHQTAQAALDNILGEIRQKYGVNRVGDKIVFDMNRSGAGITYDELAKDAGHRAGFHIPSPDGRRRLWIVDYVEDRDIWVKKLPKTDEFTAYMGTRPMTFGEWDRINAMTIDEIAEKGEAVLDYIKQYGKKANEQARYEKIADWNVPVVNMPYMNCSEHLHELLNVPGGAPRQFVASYFRTLKGEWQFSLRSVGDFDVSEVAKRFGGGGHKHSAGFKISVLPWEVEGRISEVENIKSMLKLSPTPIADAENEAAPMYGEVVPGSTKQTFFNQVKSIDEDEVSLGEVAKQGSIPVVATSDGDDSVVKLGESSE
jgi:oligoribonuclease NrnB/cAMP/cGMP phosphodiesterase (DHH superfamily)